MKEVLKSQRMIDYTMRYGLEFDPFLKNAKDIFVDNDEQKEIMYRLNFLAETKGIGLLTAPPGGGKTTVVRFWANSLNKSLYNVIYSCLSTLSVNEFYREMATNLGLKPAYRKTTNYHNIKEEVSRLSSDKRKTPVFIFDEANYISNQILNDLKLLFNFEMDSKDRAIVLLVGLPELNSTLNQPMHEPLRQRLVMNYNMEPMNKEDGRNYVKEKLSGAGCKHEIFENSAMEAILNTADGSPRMINKICSRCLLIGHKLGKESISLDIAMEAAQDIELG